MPFMEGENLRKIMPNGDIKICINEEEVKTFVETVPKHEGKHLRTNPTWQLALIGPYWWLTIHMDVYIAYNIDCLA